MKRELIWWILFLVLAVFVVGLMTSFQFGNIDIQLHDTYYVFPSLAGILLILIIFGLLRGLIKLTDRLSDKSKSVAIAITVINGLFGLNMIILIYASIVSAVRIKQWYPDLDISNYVALIIVLISVLCLLTIIEIKAIKKLMTKRG